MLEDEKQFSRINRSEMFRSMNFLGFWEAKILDLASIIILAIKTLRIIKVEDKESIIENWVIDHALLDEISHSIDSGTVIRRVAILTHQ